MDAMTPAGIAVRALAPGDHREWAAFLARSENPTLFHDLDFLAYHPEGRHRTHHLLFHEGARLVALLTGTIVADDGGDVYRSCPAASVGGFVYDRKVRLSGAAAVVAALLDHAQREGWRSIQITLPPPVYNGRVGQLTSFALARAGFAPVNQQVSFLLPLAPGPIGFERLFRPPTASQVRGALRKGVTVDRGGAALLPDFMRLFEQTYARHGTQPTHGPAEIAWLVDRLGDRVTFFVARLEGHALAALCVFKINTRVATTFYICSDFTRRNENGVLVAIADTVERLAQEGLQWLDLGPSGDLERLNEAVIAFKEGAGPTYALREHWRVTI